MSTTKTITGLIRRLRSGEDTQELRADVRGFLAGLHPLDLPRIEKELTEAGFTPEDLRPLCDVHVHLAAGTLEQLRDRLESGHVLHTMIAEHDRILGFLDELERVNERIQRKDAYRPGDPDFEKLGDIAHHLVEAEKHHRREEDVLFPELEKRGVTCPPQVMRTEHELMRDRKNQIAELAERADRIVFPVLKARLDEAVGSLLLTLRDHILKENNILYAMALEVITEPYVWDDLKARCDKIGYCCFTPST